MHGIPTYSPPAPSHPNLSLVRVRRVWPLCACGPPPRALGLQPLRFFAAGGQFCGRLLATGGSVTGGCVEGASCTSTSLSGMNITPMSWVPELPGCPPGMSISMGEDAQLAIGEPGPVDPVVDACNSGVGAIEIETEMIVECKQ